VTADTRPLEVIFVCTGNICRSPMAEIIAHYRAAEQGLTGVRFTSAGVSNEEQGNDLDPRARQVLTASGYIASARDRRHPHPPQRVHNAPLYPDGSHAAHRITNHELDDADLIVCLEERHRANLERRGADRDKLVLLTDFDPTAQPGDGVPDPWYGPASGFKDTQASIERAMPELFEHLRQMQR
jgi:protein-tyrosine phosphatase